MSTANDERIVLRHPKGSSTTILLYGATIISWQSATHHSPEQQERLFVSSTAALDGSKPVRGGIPVVFPCFGAPTHPDHKQLAQHGFARNSVWKHDGSILEVAEAVSVTLTLEPTDAIRAVYGKPFHLSYIVKLSEFGLGVELQVKNISTAEPIEFQALFHNYIRAPADEVIVTPLQNATYYDKTEKTEEGKASPKIERRAGVDVKAFTDSVYENTSQNYQVTWPDGGVAIETTLKDLVVWNPQAEAGSKIGDMEPGGWEKYVCAEPGHVCGFAKVEPGNTWTGIQILSILQPKEKL